MLLPIDSSRIRREYGIARRERDVADVNVIAPS
jgi:hypothetical protein